jgi:signal recognition particle GTPase
LDKKVKQNAVEEEKLDALSKKLAILKTMVAKFETKIEQQRSKLSTNAASLKCLFNGVQTRTSTCSKFEEVCLTVGRSLMGPHYRSVYRGS